MKFGTTAKLVLQREESNDKEEMESGAKAGNSSA
jgi:hypothetical protein